MKPFGFPRRARLRGRWEFTRAQRSGEKIHVRFFIVFVLPSPAIETKARQRARALERQVQRHGDALVRLNEPPAFAAQALSEDVSAWSRLGVTVTKKVGNAVLRNRIKRWARESFRQVVAQLPRGFDWVVVAKQQATGASFAEVLADFQRLAQRSLARKAAANPPRSVSPAHANANLPKSRNGRDRATVLKVERGPGQPEDHAADRPQRGDANTDANTGGDKA